MKFRFKPGLLGSIAIAIAAGIAVGYIAPMWLAQTFATFNSIFSHFLGFMIPLIIIGFVTPAIADVGGRAGKLLAATALLAYAATFLAGLLSYFTGTLTFPSLIGGEAGVNAVESGGEIAPFFTIEMPPLMPVMTSLVLAFLVGLGIAFIKGDVLRHGFEEFRTIVAKSIDKARWA